MRLVDLSHPVETGMQVFPGDPPVRTELAATVPQDGFQVSGLHLGTHSGTHVDAPLHTVDGGAPVDTLDLLRLLGPARIVRVAGLKKTDTIRWTDVEAQLEEVAPGDIVLFHTGWSRYFDTGAYLQHPVIEVLIAERLVAAGVTVIGVDTLNPDPTPGAGGVLDLPVHSVILGAGGAILENLTNLDAVTWPNPVVSALPLKLRGLDGSPVRAVALEL